MPTDQTDLAAAQAFRDARDAATPNWCNYYHRKRVFRNLCKWPQVGSGALIANFESFADAGFAIAARNTDLPERLERRVAEVERLRKILAHVPARIALEAKESAGYGDEIKPMSYAEIREMDTDENDVREM